MLSKILSVSDVKRLKVGDELLDSAEPTLAKIYVVKNISPHLVYAIHDDGRQELKLLDANEIPKGQWWIREDS